MPKFEYFIKDSLGRDVKGIEEAENTASLVTELHKKGFTIVQIHPARERSPLFSVGQNGGKRRRKKIKLEDMVIFSRQMATMLNAGVPLVQSLDILAQQMENPTFQEVASKLKAGVEGGKSFSESLEEQKKYFSPLFVNMIRAGETSGKLDEILDRLSAYMEKTNALIKKLKSAMVYPAVVTAVAISISYAMFAFVIPKFAEIFSSIQARLPYPTELAIAASNFIRSNSLFMIISIVAGVFLFRMIIKTPPGRLWFDRTLLSLPVFGPLFLKAAVSKFCRTLATLVKSGVPILGALEIVSKTAGNRQLELIIDEVRLSIKEGGGMAEPLSKSKYFPPMVTRMIAVGEETGEMEQMLGKIADFYEVQVDMAVQGITALIEPLIIVFLGIVIGGIVIAMFLPILSLTQAIR
ncbi:MAG: type II secretion system F family protein [Candidatus Omnitrophica bacterium]|nr:type II secretion system F family protein [Candidatus Omnitrophota bacterium]